MFSLIVMALHLAAADPAEVRKSYMACLSTFAKESAKKKMSLKEFEAALAGACKSEETAFRKAAVDFDVARGIGRRTSESGVNDELVDMRLSAKERFELETEEVPPAE
jgi:hypothetical protein